MYWMKKLFCIPDREDSGKRWTWVGAARPGVLYYFFSIRQADNAYLFDGLEISKNKEAMQYQNQYPVIFMSLKDLKDLSFQDQLNNFQIILSEIISRNEELLISEHLDEMDRDLLKSIKQVQ